VSFPITSLTSRPMKLGGWKDGAARRAVVEFAERTVSDGIPRDERVARFDNDGTLWCEKPMPIQADFTIRRSRLDDASCHRLAGRLAGAGDLAVQRFESGDVDL
jgi:hypothetical protein